MKILVERDQVLVRGRAIERRDARHRLHPTSSSNPSRSGWFALSEARSPRVEGPHEACQRTTESIRVFSGGNRAGFGVRAIRTSQDLQRRRPRRVAVSAYGYVGATTVALLVGVGQGEPRRGVDGRRQRVSASARWSPRLVARPRTPDRNCPTAASALALACSRPPHARYASRVSTPSRTRSAIARCSAAASVRSSAAWVSVRRI